MILFGGRMEKKIRTNLGTIYDRSLLSSAIINCLSTEYLIDLIKEAIRSHNKETDLTKLSDDFADVINESYDVSFSSMSGWLEKKSQAFTDLLALVVDLDEYLASLQKIEKNQIVSDIQTKLNNFIVQLTQIKIDDSSIDFASIDLKDEYINSTMEQLSLVNEGQSLSELASTQLEFAPLDVERNRNTFIEEKLNKINSITSSCEHTFNSDLKKLENEIVTLYDKVYDVSYATLTDGEKAEKTRKILKFVNPHKQLLDKLENKLTLANELKRQLIIHKKRLDESLKVENDGFKKRIEENPDQKDLFINQMDGVNFITQNYFTQIDVSVDRVNKLEERITKQFKVLDQLELAFKNALPSENDMKKYSSIAYKFQELQVRLELSKSQITKEQSDLKIIIDTANMGLATLIAHAVDFKDLYLRNCMITATFKAVDAIYDFVNNSNKSTALSQMKFLNEKLAKYSELSNNFSNDILLYRKVGNDAIRDIAIIMGKPMGVDNLKQVIEIIDITNSQFEHLYSTLDNNNKQQIEVVHAIMEI